MNPFEDRRPIDADDRPLIDGDDFDDEGVDDEPILGVMPLEADEADVLEQRAAVQGDDDDRHV